MRNPGGPETVRHIMVDGGNLVHRAHFGRVASDVRDGRPPRLAPGGLPIGVTAASLSLLGDWLGEMTPPANVSVFFDGTSSRRMSLDPYYKSDRSDGPSVRLVPKVSAETDPILRVRDGHEVKSDVALLARILSLLGCKTFLDSDEECDDLIASFCTANPDTIRTIVSDDKDFFQLLVDPRIVIFRPGAKSGHRFVDAEGSTSHWSNMNGGKHPAIPPAHVRMFKSLCGDPSDGIPGVYMLRKRVAASICHLLSIDEVLADNMSEFSAIERNRVIESADRIRTNYELVGLRHDVNLSSAEFGPSKNVDLACEILSDIGISADVLPFSKIGRTKAPKAFLSLPSWLD